MKVLQQFEFGSIAQMHAMENVLKERFDQDETFGRQVHDPAYWLAIMGKQIGQLGSAILNYKWASLPAARAAAKSAMYHEAKQVAAVAIAMMEAVEQNTMVDEVTSTRPRNPRHLARALNRGDDMVQYDKNDNVEDTNLPEGVVF